MTSCLTARCLSFLAEVTPNNRVEPAHGVRSTHKRPRRLFAAHAGR